MSQPHHDLPSLPPSYDWTDTSIHGNTFYQNSDYLNGPSHTSYQHLDGFGNPAQSSVVMGSPNSQI